MAKSPSITILEKNMSAYTVTSSDTVLAIVGYATKGPIGTPTLVTSRTDFNTKFGTSVIGSPYAALAAYRAFNQGNQVIFDRVATETGDYAASAAEVVVSTDAVTASAGTMGIDLGADPMAGLTAEETYGLVITIDGGTEQEVSITADGSEGDTVASVKTEIDTALTAEGTGATAALVGNIITITSGTTGILSKVLIATGSEATNDLIGSGTEPIVVVAAVDGVAAADGDFVQFAALEKGSSTNLLSVVKSTRTNPVTDTDIYKIEVLYDDEVVETFDDVSFTIANATYFKTVINQDSDNGGSEYIEIDVLDGAVDALTTVLDDGTYELGEGTTAYTALDALSAYDYVLGLDGFDSEAIALANEGLFTAELTTASGLANGEAFDYHILITPDMPEVTVQDAALTLAEYREDFIYIVDPPFGYTYDEVVDWHNGKHGDRTSAINTSYGAMYWSWLKDFNSDTSEYVWCPPSVFVAEKFMEVDRLYGPWAAPAGDLRGKITAADYESSPSFAERELMYGDFNAVNPIVNFVSKGLEIYGQKTLLRDTSSLNRLSVRRMIIFAKKLIKKALEAIIFEPHNPESWRKATNSVTAILEPIRQAGGIDKYSVIIDSSVNTADVIAQNIMKGTIKIIPMNTIEIVEITMQVHKSGASLSE